MNLITHILRTARIDYLVMVLCSSFSAALAADKNAESAVFMQSLQELQTLDASSRAKKLNELSVHYDSLVDRADVKMSPNLGKLMPPTVAIGGIDGWSPVSECEPVLEKMYPDDQDKQLAAKRSVAIWRLFISYAPLEAFGAMKSASQSPSPNTLDIVHMMAAMQRAPGEPISQTLPKELWSQFYRNPNPCYKILALEKYDSTEQTPEELLKLYRECLFDSFGYLQVRALEGIYRNQDYREAVRDLLREYLASNPKADDGTLPAYPASMRNPVDGAKMILEQIAKHGATAQPPTPATGSKSSQEAGVNDTVMPPQAKQPKKADQSKATPSASQSESKSWLVWLLVVTAATAGAAWLLLRKRK